MDQCLSDLDKKFEFKNYLSGIERTDSAIGMFCLNPLFFETIEESDTQKLKEFQRKMNHKIEQLIENEINELSPDDKKTIFTNIDFFLDANKKTTTPKKNYINALKLNERNKLVQSMLQSLDSINQ